MAHDLIGLVANQNLALDAMLNYNGGGNLIFYSGSIPATLADTPGTAVATVPVIATSKQDLFDGSTDASLVSTAVGHIYTTGKFAYSASVSPGGTPTYFRLTSSGGTAFLQGTVGTSGCDINLDNGTIASGASVTISSFNVTMSALS